MPTASVVVVISALLGWSDITIQASRGDRGFSSLQSSIAGIDRPSERTVETLKRYDLERVYRGNRSRNVDKTLQSLEKLARKQPNAELVYALAELSWIDGLKQDRWRKAQAIDRFLDAVAYAHDYLFDPELAEGRGPSDPRFRLACDLYNAGLERLIRAAQSKDPIDPQGVIRLKVHGHEQVLQVVLRDSPWTPADVHKLILASDFEVSGLATSHNQYGLGVPLIGVRMIDPKKEERPPQERFFPDEMAFALTAFLVPNSRLRDPAESVDEVRKCTLELIDPVRHRVVGQPPFQIALETDLTTPLAYMWSRTDLDRFRWSGLLHPEQGLQRANLLMIRPYEPGKIPVVMVHGLISTPLAWIPMLNELLRDPAIQEHYQFFLYMYPTGVPIPIAAASLRDALVQARMMFNPDGSDPQFDRMVLLGHSMGGLLSHFMVVSSGEQLWRLYSDRSFDEILGPRNVLDELQRLLFFGPLPFVSRVVFLATPHRGSDLARGVVGRVGANLINDPDHIQKLLYQLLKDNPDAFDRRRFRRFPTSIETLDPSSPILKALLAMKPGPEVAFHSIIGSLRPSGVEETTDGVVPFQSAHLDGALTEKVVRSDHGVQKDGEAIQEVRAILRMHIGLNTQLARGVRAGATLRAGNPSAVAPSAVAPASASTLATPPSAPATAGAPPIELDPPLPR
ncbi:MAG: esterase/lipase family protein [Isosphaeraceae bacterium]